MGVLNRCVMPLVSSMKRYIRRAAAPRGRVMAVLLFAGLNPSVDPVLPGWERACGVRGKGARRVVGLIKVQNHVSISRQVRVEKPTRAVSFFPGRLVPKNEEQLFGVRLFQNRVEAKFPAMKLEGCIPGTVVKLGLTH